MPLCRCKAHKSHSLCKILRSSRTLKKHVGEVGLTFCIPLFLCQAVESNSFRIVLFNTLAVSKHVAQVRQSANMSLCRGKEAETQASTTHHAAEGIRFNIARRVKNGV